MTWDLNQLITALFAGTIFYELIFKHPDNVENAVDIAKDPAIPAKDKLPKYWQDKKVIDSMKDKGLPVTLGHHQHMQRQNINMGTDFTHYNPGNYPYNIYRGKDTAFPRYVAGIADDDV